MNKHAQVNIFVIVAVILVAIVSLFFILRMEISPESGGQIEKNPSAFIKNCMEDKIEETIKLISSQGGHVNNKLHIKFQFSHENKPANISYLCYNQNYYYPCINQEPMLIKNLEDEIKENINDEINQCFEDLVLSLEKQGNVVDVHYQGFEVDLISDKIIIKINSSISLTKSGETASHKNFKIIYPSKLYELAVIVQEINSQEARFCNFEYLGFMLLYPEFNIDKFRTGESTIIYTIEDRKTGEWFRFAVRGCVIPPGF